MVYRHELSVTRLQRVRKGAKLDCYSAKVPYVSLTFNFFTLLIELAIDDPVKKTIFVSN